MKELLSSSKNLGLGFLFLNHEMVGVKKILNTEEKSKPF